jgi:hypothetical protein
MVYLVRLVSLVRLVCLVRWVCLVEPEKPDKPDKRYLYPFNSSAMSPGATRPWTSSSIITLGATAQLPTQ